jgi:spore coat protein U-like protein
MRRSQGIGSRVVLVAALAGPAVAALAATGSTTFNVGATIRSNCLISSASNLAFGAYAPGLGAAVDSNSTIVVRCQAGTPYGIGLSVGSAGGTMATRQLSSATVPTTLEYNLYTTAARTQAWENPSIAAATVNNQGGVGGGMGMPQSRTHTVYGRLPDSAGNRNAMPATDYRSTITLTINY